MENKSQYDLLKPENESEEISELRTMIENNLRTVYDPEIPVNIFELGLIYEVRIDSEKKVDVKMTLTAPNCPAAQSLPAEIEVKTKEVPGVTSATVEVIWEPVWTMDNMSEAAKLELGML